MPDVADLLRKCLPDLDLRSLESLGEGDFCRAYLVNHDQVVRIPKHVRARLALQREACLLARLQPHLTNRVPAPTFLAVEEGGASLAIHPYLQGDGLDMAAWRALAHADRRDFACRVGRVLAELHAVDVEIGIACGLERVDLRGALGHLLARLGSITARAALPDGLREALRSCIGGFLAEASGSREAPALLHRDFGPPHVLVDRASLAITGVIDWGDAAIGDPARDFIFIYEDWGREYLDAALEGYPAGEPRRFWRRVLRHYLADQTDWTLTAWADGRTKDAAHGVQSLGAALEDLKNAV